MKKLSIVLVVFVVGILLCGFAPKETTYFTIYYANQKIVVTDTTLKPKWYNADSYKDFTKGKSIYERATSAKTLSDDFPEIYQILKRIEREIEYPAFDGNIHFKPSNLDCFVPRNDTPGGGRFWVTDARNGIEMDVKSACREILDALKNRTHADIIIKTKEVVHKTEAQVLSKIGLRAEYSTRFDATNHCRSGNIKRSVLCFNGLVLLPGEEISFNRTVGPRTAERGYEEAKIIIDGEFVPGIGGGVCQTSTTLFNAALLSGLTIVKSSNHSLPISYVPLGRDAMVSSVVDLILENNTGAPVYFETGIEKSNRVFVKVYGNKLGNLSYKPKTEVITKAQEIEVVGEVPAENNRKVIIEDGYPPRSVLTYLETYNGSNLVNRKLLRKSNYKGKTEVIRYELTPETSIDTLEQ